MRILGKLYLRPPISFNNKTTLNIRQSLLSLKNLKVNSVTWLLIVQGLAILLFFGIGYFELKPDLIKKSGYAVFASDSFACHEQAKIMCAFLEEGEFEKWYSIQSRFHTRVASFCYLTFGKVFGMNISALWPINGLFLCLSWLFWKRIVCQLGGVEPKHSFFWLMFPVLIIHYTQLLRDPFYITFFLMWLNGWLNFFKCREDKSLFKYVLLLLILCPLLYWSRHRFWVLAQCISIACLFLSTYLWAIKKKTRFFMVVISILVLAINSYSIVKTVKRYIGVPVKSEMVDGELINKPFVFFYKIAFLRKKFTKSYQQNSSLDPHVEFNSDLDVVKYVPRALQISFFMPFPNMWLSSDGKTGRVGKLVSAWEMILMFIVFFLIIKNFSKVKKNSLLMILCLTVLIYFIALGLVVTNGGALYRMRLCSWLLIGAIAHSSIFRDFSQDNHVKLEESNED